MLIVLLSPPIAAMSGAAMAYFGIHPVSVVLFLALVAGARLSAQVNQKPMWQPVETRHTRKDEPEDEAEAGRIVLRPAMKFAGLVAVEVLA